MERVVEPPKVSLETATERLRFLTPEEENRWIEQAKTVPALIPVMDNLEAKFGERAKEIYTYALNKIPLVFEEYIWDMLTVVRESGLSIENSDTVREATQRMVAVRTVGEAKSELDRLIGDYLKVESYFNPLFEAPLLPFALLTRGRITVPYPPERVGVPRVITVPTEDIVVDFIDVDVATIKGRSNIFGPRLHTDRPLKFEVTYTTKPRESGVCATVGLVLVRFLTGCPLAPYWVRAWAPIKFHHDEFTGQLIKRFTFSPDYTRILALRIIPWGKNTETATVRRIA